MPFPALRVGRGFAAVCLAFLTSLRAQDVIVGDPVWFSTQPAPDTPLKTGNLKPEFPEEMIRGDEVGYVILSRNIDATGKNISLAARGTHLPFQRAVEQAYRLGWTFPPVKRDGKRVAARFWLPVIFNPKSATPKGPDATPRVLAAAPALTLLRPAPANEPQVVRMKLTIDETGAITGSAPLQKVSPNLRAAVDTALKQWRVAPARKAGQPMSGELIVPVLCHGMRLDQSNFVPARIAESVRPIYPASMRRYGVNGSVTFNYTIDEEGRVQNPTIHESDNPAFDEPALTALRQWKYQPATRDGKPVASNVRQSISFTFEGGDSAYRVSQKLDASKLPENLRYDVPPKVRGVLVPVHPYPLRRDAVRGKARAAIAIDATGQVAGVKVLEADRPEFGRALTAALEGFKFDPAYRDGKPVPSMISFEQQFNPYELPDEAGSDMLGWEKKSPEKFTALAKLDAPLKVVSRREPRFPLQVPADVMDGDAVVECIIDKHGRVRLPRVKSASDEAFGYAAVQAVSAWWFEPPLVNGKGVAVREEIPLRFSRKVAAPTPTAAKKKTTKAKK
jgi:TonB family protein